jgi:hypothetical protein
MGILKVLPATAADGKRAESPVGLLGVLPDVAQPEATHTETAVQAQSTIDGGPRALRLKAP